MAEIFDQFSMKDLTALAGSSAGRQLISLLQQSAGQTIQQAAGKAASGDLEGAKALLSPVLADPKIKALLDRMGGK